jgi:hypothetical protein
MGAGHSESGGNPGGPGIGYYDGPAGEINIEGGVIFAFGTDHGAGIGSGLGGRAGGKHHDFGR